MSEGNLQALCAEALFELNPEEQVRAQAMVQELDLNDAQTIAQFGSGAQSRLAEASGVLLKRIQGEGSNGGAMMEEILALANSLDISSLEEEQGFLSRLLGKRERELNKLARGYNDAATRIDHLLGELDMMRMGLLKDIGIYDQLYTRNLQQLRDLEIDIIAGQQVLSAFCSNEVATKAKEAASNGSSIVRQALNDAQGNAEHFKKKLYDLKVSHMVALQMASQIRLMQNNNRTLADQMQQTITQTIPLWENQLTLAIGMARQQQALKAQRTISQAARNTIKRNAEILKENTREIAKESSQGILALEDLKAAERELKQGVSAALAAQQAGREQRQQIEKELLRIETDLKQVSVR